MLSCAHRTADLGQSRRWVGVGKQDGTHGGLPRGWSNLHMPVSMVHTTWWAQIAGPWQPTSATADVAAAATAAAKQGSHRDWAAVAAARLSVQCC